MSKFYPSVSVWARMWRRQRRGWPYTLVAVFGAGVIWSLTIGRWSVWLSAAACVAFGLAVGLVQCRLQRHDASSD